MKKKLDAIIKELKRCAAQNSRDAKEAWDRESAVTAWAVAAEQRRMIKILQQI